MEKINWQHIIEITLGVYFASLIGFATEQVLGKLSSTLEKVKTDVSLPKPRISVKDAEAYLAKSRL